ncbi:MAG: hypothetical protein ACD_3C00031G0003 [uncultured bacterium (gcode 4)]|uniref:Uncharacterized protein n=1 Tax=uncultured bacterium (gcode 4) TaxID=1234023 RepID=K2GEM2_9BACT|nr:MAG: hypothetical protein ACD_3C00031G0003 [uncultured bacterium (gcode 4)]
MAETKRSLDIWDDNRNWTELDELQNYLSKNSQVPREFVDKYVDALALANSKKLLKEEARVKASEFLKNMLDQKLKDWIQVSEPETLDLYIKSWLYNNAFFEECKAQLIEAKAASSTLRRYGDVTNKIVFDLKIQKNWKLFWKSGEFWNHSGYEKIYSVPKAANDTFNKGKNPKASPEITDENNDWTNLDELQRYMKNSTTIPRDIVLKYMEALSLAKTKNLVKAETRELASEFLKKMLDQRLITWLKVSEPETIDLFIKSWFYNKAFLEGCKVRLLEAKSAAWKLKWYWEAPNKVVFSLKLKDSNLVWGSKFWEETDEKIFWNIKTDLTDSQIHNATPSWAASSDRVDWIFAEITSTDRKISEKPQVIESDIPDYLKAKWGDTSKKSPDIAKPKRRYAKKAAPEQKVVVEQKIDKWDIWIVNWTNVRLRNSDDTFNAKEMVSTWVKLKLTWETKKMKKGIYYWVDAEGSMKYIHAKYVKVEKNTEVVSAPKDALTEAKNKLLESIDKASESTDTSAELEAILGRAIRINRKKTATLEEVQKITSTLEEYLKKCSKAAASAIV